MLNKPSVAGAKVSFLLLDNSGSESDNQADENNELIERGEESKSVDNDAKKEHKHEPVLELIEKFCCLIIWPLSKIMPVNACPELAMFFVFFLIYIFCEFIVTVFNVFSVYTGLSHFLVGLSLMVWGSDQLELINMTIAMKNQCLELGMTSVISCQFICLVVIIPIAALSRMYSQDADVI